MRHEKFWIAGATLVLMATACNDASSITGPDFALLNDRTREQDLPWPAEPAANPCNNDLVGLDGKSHVVLSIRVDNALGFHLTWNVSSRGTGTGLGANGNTAGKTYTVSGEDNYTAQFLDPTANTTFVHKLVAIGPQQEDNFVLHITAHVTWNVNDPDSPSAAFDHVDAKCTG